MRSVDALMQTATEHPQTSGISNPLLSALALGALGIVFGDLVTSPLYALQEAFGAHGAEPNPANVLGVLSVMFWSLVVVVSLKYVLFIMRVDNNGECGITALLALAHAGAGGHGAADRRHRVLRRQPDEVCQRRLVPAGTWHR